MSLRSRRSGAALSALLVLGGLVALLAAAWAVALSVGGNERDRADARLATEVRAAAAGFSARVASADASAGTLAARPALQRAVLRRDKNAVRRLVGARQDIAVIAGGRLLAGSLPAPAVTRTARIVLRGRSIGRVVVVIPLGKDTLDGIAEAAGVRPPDRLIARTGDAASAMTLGRAADFGTSRVFAEQIVDRPSPVVLAAITPRSEIGNGTTNRTLWLVLASLISVATLAIAARGVYVLLWPRIRPTPRRRDVRQVLSLVGDALASTHDPERLLPVILHASMEATGAVAGVAVRGGEEVAREGTFERTGQPLRLELASTEMVGEDLALILHPAPTGFDERTVTLAHSLVAQAAVALDNARLHGIVQRQAVTDELTGLSNRRFFRDALETELQRAERFGNPLSLIVADLDDFKRINDRFGHQAGDEVLRTFAETLRGRIRGVDLGARLGGEEFAVLLPETEADGAKALAENLRAAVAGMVVPIGQHQLRITASFGVAAFPQTHTADELMTAADLALYSAKRQGKDRVIAVTPQEP